MSHTIAIFPGSFDPFTRGHQALVDDALRIFDKVVIGIGNNVHEQTFSPDAAQVAGYLDAWTDRPVSRGELAKALLEELDGLETLDGLREYRAACLTLGRTVRLLRPDGTQQAEALDIDRDYGLIVRYGDGREETVRSGEVSVRGLYGYIE